MDPLCRQIQDQFIDYIDLSLAFAERERVQEHLLSCNRCTRALDMTRQLINLCNKVGEEPLPPGFSARLRDRIEGVSPATIPAWAIKVSTGDSIVDRRWWIRKIFPSLQPARIWALAGLALLLFLIPLYLFSIKTEQTERPAAVNAPIAGTAPVHVALNKDTFVRIWFDARKPVEGVRFYLELPDGIAMVQDGQVVAERRLEWEGDLQSGRNLIPLTVRGVARGQWRVTVLIEKGLARKERSVDIKVNGV